MRNFLGFLTILSAACGGGPQTTVVCEARPAAQATPFHIRPGAAIVPSDLPAGAFGYLVTSNGQGDYVVVWTDSANTAAQFTGTIENNGGFSSVAKFNGLESIQQTAINQITFASVPGASEHGVTFTSASEPIYIYGAIDCLYSTVSVYFKDASSGVLVQTPSPATLTSP